MKNNKDLMRFFILFTLFTSQVFAAGGFEKPVLWSARAAQRAGAYSAEVSGAEALVFNPAGMIQSQKKELGLGISAAFTTYSAAVVENNKEVSNTPPPVTPPAFTYAQQIDSKSAVGVGLYASGGLNVAFDDVHLEGLDSNFASFRPDVYAKLNMLQLGVGYARQLNSNLSVGAALRGDYIWGSFGETQVISLGGNLAAVNYGEFKDLKGFGSPSILLGAKYLTDDKKTGLGLTYRSKTTYRMESKFSGNIVYTAFGAGATGQNAGQVYDVTGTNSDVETSLPQALTASIYRKVTDHNTAYFEYTWTEYSDNRAVKIDGKATTPGLGTTEIPDHDFKWKDMHDFKFGWTNTSIESWILGGGYSLTLPVTKKNYAGATTTPAGNYHHFYAGAGKMFEKYRVDGAFEYYFSKGKGKSVALPNVPSIEGTSEASAYAISLSTSYYF